MPNRPPRPRNLEAVVNRGRMPGLLLQTADGERAMTDCAGDLFDALTGIAGLLDTATGSTLYSAATRQQAAAVADPELTPSARVLREMRETELPFFRLTMDYSQQWARHFRDAQAQSGATGRLRA